MDDHTGAGRAAAPGTPRWVTVFGLIALAVVLVLVVLKFAGAGAHGPSRHMPRGDTAQQSSY